MNALKFWKWLVFDCLTFYAGSSGAGAPANTTSSVTTTSIPDYAKPYAKAMMGGALSQAFNVDPKTGQILNTRPYTPFTALNSTDYATAMGQADKGVAGFTPLQDQAFQGIAGLQTPEQYQQAMGATTDAMNRAKDVSQEAAAGSAAAGKQFSGDLSGAGQQAADIGQGGLGYGALGAQQGLSYGQNATDANAVQAYMNPYLQASLAPGLQQLQQQMGIQGANQQSAAASSGAFGGSRSALANSLNTQAGNLAQQSMIGQGYSNAYNTAQQNMQQASQLGMQGSQIGLQGIQQALAGQGLNINALNDAGNIALQGYNQQGQIGLAGTGQALTGANQLAAIGGKQLADQEGILGLQQQVGGTQQQQEQNRINQASQDYTTAQQTPYDRYAFLSNMLRGLPMGNTGTTQNYTASPNRLSQVAGLGVAGLGAAKAMA